MSINDTAPHVTYQHETQGKCTACRAVYRWTGAPRLRDALCPVHRMPLHRTSYLSSLLVKHERPATREAVQA